MVTFPIAKINLGLNITGRRDDGFHNIETIFYPVNLCDALELVISGSDAKRDLLSVTGIDPGGDPEDNIVLRAVESMRSAYSFPYLKIHLHKSIPAGAGLGGGSSDAAHMLKAIARTFELPVSTEELKAVSLGLGSDCPFFIDTRPAFASGRGEIMEPLDPVLEGYRLVLVNPGIAVSTKEAYRNCIPGKPVTPLTELVSRPLEEWKYLVFNDFEKSVFTRYPQLEEIKNQLYKCGASYSSMSGSGSTIYGIFEGKPSLPAAIEDLVVYEGVV